MSCSDGHPLISVELPLLLPQSMRWKRNAVAWSLRVRSLKFGWICWYLAKFFFLDMMQAYLARETHCKRSGSWLSPTAWCDKTRRAILSHELVDQIQICDKSHYKGHASVSSSFCTIKSDLCHFCSSKTYRRVQDRINLTAENFQSNFLL